MNHHLDRPNWLRAARGGKSEMTIHMEGASGNDREGSRLVARRRCLVERRMLDLDLHAAAFTGRATHPGMDITSHR